METKESMEESLSRSLDVQPSSEGLETISEPIPSGSRSTPKAVTARPALCAGGAPVPHSVLYEATCPGSHQRSHGRFGFQPNYVSCIPQDPCKTADLSSSPDPTTLHPCHSSVQDSGSGSGSGSGLRLGLSQSSEPSQGSGPTSGPAPASGPGSASGPEPADSGPCHKLCTCIPQEFRCLPIDLLRDYNACYQHAPWKPQHSWEPLQVSEPGVRGPCKPPEVESEQILSKTRPRGQCLLYNWEEERATNQLDEFPPVQDGSESYFFRHGHQGLLSMQLRSPMSSSTTQKDSYQLPRHTCQPLRGKREAMLEMFLRYQICKEVQTEQAPTRKPFETESVTHRDYKVDLVQTGPPAPSKPHDYRQEQPETFWIQRAAQLPGVSNIRTLDTPFRKNCSFSTPVPLSLGQPLPYELENGPHHMGGSPHRWLGRRTVTP